MQRTTDIKEELSKRLNHQKEISDMPDQAFPENINAESTNNTAIRLLRADERECRVSTINVYGLRLLLYKDARVDQKILDEAFTPFGWQRTHQEIDGKLYCTVSVWDDARKQWISKQDVGTASYSDKEKGQASDSFKRACFNWGIGRELYTAPDIWVPAARVYIKEDTKKKDHYVTTDRFSVQSIAYNDRKEIDSLVIIDQNEKEIFRMLPKRPNTQKDILNLQLELLQHELERTGIQMETVLERYNIQDISQITPETCIKALNGLWKTKTKGAA